MFFAKHEDVFRAESSAVDPSSDLNCTFINLVFYLNEQAFPTSKILFSWNGPNPTNGDADTYARYVHASAALYVARHLTMHSMAKNVVSFYY